MFPEIQNFLSEIHKIFPESDKMFAEIHVFHKCYAKYIKLL